MARKSKSSQEAATVEYDSIQLAPSDQPSKPRSPSKSPSELLTERETAKAQDRRETPTVTLIYTDRSDRRLSGQFTRDEISRCHFCGRNQPQAHIANHMSWEHGVNSEDGTLTHPPSPHYEVPVPSHWELERM